MNLKLTALFLLSFLSFATSAEKTGCIFCEIAGGQRPASLIYRDARLIAIMDIAPKNPGHVLIIPTSHSDDLIDLPPETAREMMALAQRIALAIKQTDIKADAFQLKMNSGPLVQGVRHAHLHVLPRFQDDPGERAEMAIPRAPREELDAIAKKIKAALEAKPAPAALPAKPSS